MSDLPPDLVEEILSRVPATALSRFRSTCKRWNALFKEQRFTNKHNDRAAKQFLPLILTEHRVSSLSVNLHGIDNNNNENTAAPCLKFKGEFSLKDSPSSSSSGQDILHLFHCDGLLLCQTRNDRLVVWNPCTGETSSILPSNHCCEDSKFALGYENNKSSSHNHKLLRYSNNSVIEFEIYEFSTGSWRIVNVTANFILKTKGVSLKGNTYWITYDNSLLSFDFSTERLGRLCLPSEPLYLCAKTLTTIREEQIAVLHCSLDSSKMEIWVTTNDKIDHTVVLLWRKLLVINRYSLFTCPLDTYSGSFIIEEEKKVVVCCNSVYRHNKSVAEKLCLTGENGVYREIDIGGATKISGKAIIFNYVPSLVQIQQGTIIP